MSGKSWRRVGGWRWPLAGMIAIGIELWLLRTTSLPMNGPEFEALCALSCWLPAWCCADLLSTPRSDASAQRERPVGEVVRRWLVRLLPALLVLGLWCGTYTLRSLQAELKLPAPRMLANISKPEDLPAVWGAWTTVFLASGFAYGAGAGLCSALARRPRRWLVAPAVVVGASQFMALGLWMIGFREAGNSVPLSNGAPVPDVVRQIITVPNYTVGSMTALLTVNHLSEQQTELFSQLSRDMPEGIAIFCWVATLLFLFIGTACTVGILQITKSRHRRHPNTAPDPSTAERPEMSSAQRG